MKFQIRFSMLFAIFVLISSCHKACGKFPVKPPIGVAGKSLWPLGLAGVFLVSQQQLLDAFKEQSSKEQAIQASFINNNQPSIKFEVSIDGEEWKQKEVSIGERIDITSGGAGIIGVRSDGNYYRVDSTVTYLIKQEDGQLKFVD